MKIKKIFLAVILSVFLLTIASCTAASHEHDYQKWDITVEPTATTPGIAKGECECGRITEVQLAVLSDTSFWEVTEFVEPTCTTEGKKVYTSKYGSVTVTLEKVDHVYSEWKFTTEPTETTSGVVERTCKFGEVETVEVPKLTDNTFWTFLGTVEPTCTVEGKKTYSSIYGDVVILIPTVEHVYGEWTIATEPTLTKEGKATRTCKFGETDEVVLPVLTDTTVWTLEKDVPATCQKEGLKVFTSIYGKVELVIAKAEHEFTPWEFTTTPTLTNGGVAKRTCKYGETETANVPALTDESVWKVKEIVEPTYDEKGHKDYESIYGIVTIDIDRLIAPYEGKTYSSFAFDADDDKGGFRFGKVNLETVWNHATVTLNEKGEGIGESFPFRGYRKFSVVDPLTGKLKVVEKDASNIGSSNPIVDDAIKSETSAYLDFESGIIVLPYNSSYNFVHVLTPFEVGVTSASSNASSWNNSLAIEYTYNGTTYRIFIYNSTVYFGVTFTNILGEAVKAEDCYNQENLYVKDREGKVLYAFSNNGENLVISDNLEGTYNDGLNDLVLNGSGKAMYMGKAGTYKVATNADYTVELYVENTYYQVTLNKEAKTYEIVKPMVTVKFNAGTLATVEDLVVNMNIEATLPAPTNTEYIFKGWFYDEELTKPVEEHFVPTKDVTLFANWQFIVVINLSGVAEGDATKVTLGEGDAIGDALPKYGVDAPNNRVFRGWYLDEKFETLLPEEATVTKNDHGITIYGKWETLPAYYGTYKGTEIWGQSSGNYSNKDLTIDENGVITGLFNGVVESYDKETQKITWKKNGSSTTVKYFWFDEESGVLATHYSSQTEIGTDFYVFSKYATTTGKVNAHYGIDAAKTAGSSYRNYFARIVNLETKAGAKDVFFYDNHIYSNITITDVMGKALTSADVKYSKNVVVRDATTGEVIFAVASIGTSFNQKGDTVDLDKYFGEYTNGEETIILDGTGLATYGTLNGTYKLIEGETNKFDLFVNDNKEYYELTLDGKTFTAVKVMVTIAFENGDGHSNIPFLHCNKNVEATLPIVTEEGYVFNGWFFDPQFTKPVPEKFIPVDDDVLYGKFSLPAVLTLCYNNGEENTQTVYSVDETVKVERPTFAKHVFLGWYTTKSFDENSKWGTVDGTTTTGVVSEDITLYAKWEDAPIYANAYAVMYLGGTSMNGDDSNESYKNVITFDEYGIGDNKAYWPFNSNTKVANYNKETGYLQILRGTTVYEGYIDKASGIIVVKYDSGAGATIDECFILTPYETSSFYGNIDSSYWNKGQTRLVKYTASNGNVYNIFIDNNEVHFGVTLTDLEGNALNVLTAYKEAKGVKVTKADKVIAKYGFNGTTMVVLDGFEGTYTDGTNTVVLDGINTITFNNVKGTYELNKESGYTLSAYVDNAYYEITLDAAKCTVVKPMVTLTFDLVDGTLEFEPETEYNKNIEATLPTPIKAGFTFKGWVVNDKNVGTAYTPTENATLTAKWNPIVDVTLVLNNTEADQVIAVEVGTAAKPTEPVYEGHIFVGWFTDEALQNEYTGATINVETTLYAKWIETPAYVGEYKGAEFDRRFASGNKNLTINADLVMSGTRSAFDGTVLPETLDAETGVMKYDHNGSKYLMMFVEQAGYRFVLINYSTNSTDAISGDVFVFVQGATSMAAKVTTWNANNERIGKLDFDGKTMLIYLNVETNQFVADIKLSDIDGKALTYDDLAKTTTLVIKDSNAKVVKELAKEGDEFIPLDGYQGTYTGALGNIVLNGAKGAKVVEEVGTYKIVKENNIEVTYNDMTKSIVVTLEGNTYTVAIDETKGTYKNANNTFVSNGDGTCTYNGNKGTYTKDGMTVTYHVNGKAEEIVLNNDGTFEAKCILSGYTFKGTYEVEDPYSWTGEVLTHSIKIVFADTTKCTGTINFTADNYSSDYFSDTFNFTGVVTDKTVVLTITSGSQANKTVTLSIENGKLTVVKETLSSPNYEISGAVLRCPDFVIEEVAKTPFAGKKFNGTYDYYEEGAWVSTPCKISIVFDDTALCQGTMTCEQTYGSIYFTFDGTLSGTTLTLVSNGGETSGVKFTINVTGETLKVTAVSDYSYLDIKGATLTCPGFKLQ